MNDSERMGPYMFCIYVPLFFEKNLTTYPYGYIKEVMKKIMNRLHRIEGQVKALKKAIEDAKDCESIITQFKATQSAFESCFSELLTENLSKCINTKDTAQMQKILKLLVK